MATVGQALTAPEVGWKRYDDSDSNFSYVGSSWGTYTESGLYNGSVHYTYTAGDYVTFNFSGTKLRIIGTTSTATFRTNLVNIFIDGKLIETFSQATGSAVLQTLDFSITGLSDEEHSVKIINNQTTAVKSGTGYVFDAIDIDDNGILKPHAPIPAPANLNATAGDAQVTLNWTTVTGATGYNIKRSTTAGGPYTTTVATNVSGTSCVDTGVVNGTTYYYVVTAVNADGESDNSNEASATPQALGKVLLQIELTDGLQKEYELTKGELDSFLIWYNNRSNGSGQPYYIFSKNFNMGPFDSREDYLVFDKIQNFEVMKFTKQ